MTERQLSDFLGAWELSREIEHDDGTHARFLGTAVWTPEGEALHYHETGRLTLPGRPEMGAQQNYVWHSDLTVCFADGRYFHTVPAAGGQTSHFCAPDQYDGYYDFSEWPEFRVSWTVQGPRKAYRMLSRYRKNP